MKNGKPIALLVGVLLVLAGTLYTVKHLRDQEQQAVATYDTESPRVSDIVLKTLASGSVQPRQEILIKPQVSGIVRRVLVEAGDVVELQPGDDCPRRRHCNAESDWLAHRLP